MALSISRTKRRSLANPSLIHLFSFSSSSPPSDQFPPQDSTDSQDQEENTSRSSYFSDIKASLRQQQQNPQFQNRLKKHNFPPLRKPENVNHSTSSTAASLEQIKKSFASFRANSINAGAPEYNQQQGPQISFQALYNRNMMQKPGDANNINESSVNNNKNPIPSTLSFATIRESLKRLESKKSANTGGRTRDAMYFGGFRENTVIGGRTLDATSFSGFRENTAIGGTEGSPLSTFGRVQETVKGDMSTEFVKIYSYEELGKKLRTLRPEVKEGEKDWFSLEELNERLKKLREMEENETKPTPGPYGYSDLRDTFVQLRDSEAAEAEKKSRPKLNVVSLISTPECLMNKPKEHLVEKYFHPNNMSSAEKLKIELAKVREVFKMSESDCGSARVQVAQLTTKIKHLSSVLHKKDKHSRKGLHGMVQRRKKLLKYLRRTDWDSYSFVLSKLGLRDNPDFKH